MLTAGMICILLAFVLICAAVQYKSYVLVLFALAMLIIAAALISCYGERWLKNNKSAQQGHKLVLKGYSNG